MNKTTRPIDSLEQWGPEADRPAPTRDEAWAHVRELTTGHYENFSVLSRLVPEALRDDFASVYAFCRWSDDLGDETGSGDEARARSLELLAWWRAGLHNCVACAHGEGDPSALTHPVHVALAETIRRRALSAVPFHHLIDAFEQDQRITEYRTWDQLLGYCAKSADPVGRIVLALAGHGDGETGPDDLYAMSDATCTALQITNFWQDVRRDLDERGRVYMPSEETGVTRAMLEDWKSRPDDPEARVPFIKALRPLVEKTWPLYETGAPLPGRLGREMGGVVWLFGAGGSSVLRAVERAGCATLWHRPRLSKAKKAWLVARASFGWYRSRREA